MAASCPSRPDPREHHHHRFGRPPRDHVRERPERGRCRRARLMDLLQCVVAAESRHLNRLAPAGAPQDSWHELMKACTDRGARWWWTPRRSAAGGRRGAPLVAQAQRVEFGELSKRASTPRGRGEDARAGRRFPVPVITAGLRGVLLATGASCTAATSATAGGQPCRLWRAMLAGFIVGYQSATAT